MSGRRSTELRRAECLAVLATVAVGRIVYTEHALPTVQPVSFFLDDEEAICRTGGQQRIAAAVDRSVVAFQADEINAADHVGWSVCGVGEAYAVVDPVRLADLPGRVPQSWHPACNSPMISVPLQRLTGNRVLAGTP
jgi:nitroimidazol reductase NimA-like FMN-containing flavoprotein (pyridoxamine 5'-phosphate oxidase superfamily)